MSNRCLWAWGSLPLLPVSLWPLLSHRGSVQPAVRCFWGSMAVSLICNVGVIRDTGSTAFTEPAILDLPSDLLVFKLIIS